MKRSPVGLPRLQKKRIVVWRFFCFKCVCCFFKHNFSDFPGKAFFLRKIKLFSLLHTHLNTFFVCCSSILPFRWFLYQWVQCIVKVVSQTEKFSGFLFYFLIIIPMCRHSNETEPCRITEIAKKRIVVWRFLVFSVFVVFKTEFLRFSWQRIFFFGK